VPYCMKGVASLLHLQVFQGDSVPQKEDSHFQCTSERGDSCFQYTSQEGDSRELPNKELNNLYTSLDNVRTDGLGQMCSALNKFYS
jgi:hypothetical protein